MQQGRSSSTCPLCDGPNECALASGARVDDCWCVGERFPRALLDSVSEADRGRCICRSCLATRPDLPNATALESLLSRIR